MAEAITIACPECEKRITVPAAAVGKKIRCKGCEHVFVIEAPAKKAPAKAPAAAKAAGGPKKAPAPGAAKPAPPPKPDDDEGDGKPYGVTTLDNAPRCPDCANEMESEDAIICLHCGYNTRTRMKHEARAVENVTGGTWFWWLFPGILCAVFALIFITFDLWYTFKIADLTAPDDWTGYIFASKAFIIWGVWMPSISLDVFLIGFAVKRLVFNPRPPERVKRKKPKGEEV